MGVHIDAGTNWLTGSGTSFVLGEKTYAAADVLVKYVDGAGDVSFDASMLRSQAAWLSIKS